MEEALDPVLRCDSCQALIKLTTLHKHGVCLKCGNKRVRSVVVLSDDERSKVEAWGYDDFLEKFEALTEVDE